ncbi:DUF3025 domain-containing protein [Burkholderia thailandensis]|uniref:DUF3025 domain-containing protein n=1 Tax=Burkholderia thailandensis TaxID=57975 RepID=UPI00358DA398
MSEPDDASPRGRMSGVRRPAGEADRRRRPGAAGFADRPGASSGPGDPHGGREPAHPDRTAVDCGPGEFRASRALNRRRGSHREIDGPSFDRIDWSAPWLAPFADRGGRWAPAARQGEAAWLRMLNDDARAERLATGRGLPLRFIEQAALPAGVAYETHIAETGAVPTRHNLHDFFNALVWFAYPRIKAALNARQAAAIDAAGVGSARGGVRDALTLFDENGALFATSDPALAAALRGFDWPTLMRASRDAWGSRCDARIVGHALAEKLVDPYKGCTAHAWIVDVPDAYFDWRDERRRAWLDERVAAALASTEPTSRGFAPLPVLGVPGWWPANASPSFYDDPQVFRSGRRAREA